MSEYRPKVGDRVRATLGGTIVEGEVVLMSANKGNCAQIELAVESWAYCDISDGWRFEQLVEVPTKFGAVIRRADGVVFCRTDHHEGSFPWFGSHESWGQDEHVIEGGFTVLFEGVDE